MMNSSDAPQSDLSALAARLSSLEFALTERPKTSPAQTRLSHASLFHYSMRATGDPVDFLLEKRIRTDPETRLAYNRMLQSQAVSFSTVARAASSEGSGVRKVGSYVVRLSGPDFIVVSGPSDEDLLTVIELSRDGDRVRLALPPSVRGHATLPLDLANDTHVMAARLLLDPISEIYLL